MLHVRTSHATHIYVTRIDASCHTYECVMSQEWMRHIKDMNASCHTYWWVVSNTRMRCVTHISAACHTHEPCQSFFVINFFSQTLTKCQSNPIGCQFCDPIRAQIRLSLLCSKAMAGIVVNCLDFSDDSCPYRLWLTASGARRLLRLPRAPWNESCHSHEWNTTHRDTRAL